MTFWVSAGFWPDHVRCESGLAAKTHPRNWRFTLKAEVLPNTPARHVPRSIHEGASDMARDIGKTDVYIVSRRRRKRRLEMLFARPVPTRNALSASGKFGKPAG